MRSLQGPVLQHIGLHPCPQQEQLLGRQQKHLRFCHPCRGRRGSPELLASAWPAQPLWPPHRVNQGASNFQINTHTLLVGNQAQG